MTARWNGDHYGVVVIPNCLCGHAAWRHIAEIRECRSRACGCGSYRPKEQAK